MTDTPYTDISQVNTALADNTAGSITAQKVRQALQYLHTRTDQAVFTVTTGTAPFGITSQTMVTNLNVEYLGGHSASYFQPLDSDLTALAALDTTTGILAKTGDATYARRTLSAPAAGITITNPSGTAGNPTFALANDLAAVEGLSGTGGVERTASDTWGTYTLTAAGKALIDDADAAAQRTTLGLGTAAVLSTGTGESNIPTNTQLGSAAFANLEDIMPPLGWRDQISDVIVRGGGANDPTWAAFSGNLYAYSFSASTMQQCWVSLHIQHDYAVGTPVYLHVHWATSGTNTGVVRWGLEYSVAKGHQQQVFPATTTVYVEQAVVLGPASAPGMHMIAELSLADAVPFTNLEPDTVILCRMFRDAAHVNDTCTDVAFAFLVDMHYQTNGFSTVNKSPDFYTVG